MPKYRRGKFMEYIIKNDSIILKDEEGKKVAEVLFPLLREGVVKITHTFVDPSLRGQGIASKLLDMLVAELRKNGAKAIAKCPYAISYFLKHPEDNDVLIA